MITKRATLALLLALVAALLSPTSSAQAADVTVDGRGAATQMWFRNHDTKLVAKLYAPGGKCSVDRVKFKFRDRDGTRYKLKGVCESRNPKVWTKTFTRKGRVLTCDGVRLMYKPSEGFWRAVVPRECTPRLANQVRAKARINTGTEIGKAGPTNYVKRG